MDFSTTYTRADSTVPASTATKEHQRVLRQTNNPDTAVRCRRGHVSAHRDGTGEGTHPQWSRDDTGGISRGEGNSTLGDEGCTQQPGGSAVLALGLAEELGRRVVARKPWPAAGPYPR